MSKDNDFVRQVQASVAARDAAESRRDTGLVIDLCERIANKVPKLLRILLAQWQPIDTAPKDGRHILVVAGDPPSVVYEAYYEEDGDRGWFQSNTHWTDAFDGQLWSVTHWMPLPTPPTGTPSDAGGSRPSPLYKQRDGEK